jgi:hypothetical protein
MNELKPKFKVGDSVSFKLINKSKNSCQESIIRGTISKVKKRKNEYLYTVNGYVISEMFLCHIDFYD